MNRSCLKLSTLSRLCKRSRYLFFSYVCFSKFSVIPFVGIHTWKTFWRKREVRTDLGNHIQPIERDHVHSQRESLAYWVAILWDIASTHLGSVQASSKVEGSTLIPKCERDAWYEGLKWSYVVNRIDCLGVMVELNRSYIVHHHKGAPYERLDQQEQNIGVMIAGSFSE